MNFNEYQDEAIKTAVYPQDGTGLHYLAIGLCEEAGEAASLIGKAIRDGAFIDESRLKKELGDVLWMVSCLAFECGLYLDDIAKQNIIKLRDRQSRGVLGGSGDDR